MTSMVAQAAWAVAATPGTNAIATATKAAGGAGKQHRCFSVSGSFSAAPAAAVQLQLLDGATVLQNWDITAAGPFHFSFPLGINGSTNTAMSATLGAGGAAIVGKVNLTGYTP